MLPAQASAIFVFLAAAPAVAFEKGPYVQKVTREGATILWQSVPPTRARVVVRAPGEADRVIEAQPAPLSEVRLEGLLPGRRYAYSVEAGGDRADGELATAVPPDTPFAFVVFGDVRSDAGAHRGLVERIRREAPDFILGTGDMVGAGSDEWEWQAFFEVERELLRENVLFPILGNHDRDLPFGSADAYRRYFAVPTESPDPERYYAFGWGNARFLVLDSNGDGFGLSDQTAWLAAELEQAALDPTVRHLFVAMHHPPYSISMHGGQRDLRDAWTPLFERFRVDAVFSGHDHCYARSEAGGVQYFISGGGGAPLYPRSPRPAEEDLRAAVAFERAYHYLRVQVIGDFVEVAAIRDDGTPIEGVSWGPPPAGRIATSKPAPVQRSAAPPLGAAASRGGGCTVGGTRGGAASRGLLVILALAVCWTHPRRH